MQRAEAHQRARKRGEDLFLLGSWNVEVIEAASELRSRFIELLRRDLGLARGDLKPQRGWTGLVALANRNRRADHRRTRVDGCRAPQGACPYATFQESCSMLSLVPHRRPWRAGLVGIASGLLLLTASAAAPVGAQSPAAGDITLTSATASGITGNFLAGQGGMTLYYFTPDGVGTSNCTGKCAGFWPPLVVTKGQEATAGDGRQRRDRHHQAPRRITPGHLRRTPPLLLLEGHQGRRRQRPGCGRDLVRGGSSMVPCRPRLSTPSLWAAATRPTTSRARTA